MLGSGSAGATPSVPLLPPMPQVERPARTSTCYALTGLDDRGRIGDTTALRALAWPPGTPVGFVMLPGVDAVLVRPGGRSRITADGRLRLPVPVRRLLNLQARDRVLLAADPQRQLLVVCTMAALDAMTTATLASALRAVAS